MNAEAKCFAQILVRTKEVSISSCCFIYLFFLGGICLEIIGFSLLLFLCC